MSQIENWRKTLEKCCKKSFRKIRIRKKNNKPLKENVSKLIDKRNILMNQFDDPKVKRKIEEISEEIAEEEAVENHKMIINNFKSLSENVENINLQQMWKLSKKMWPKNGVTLPTAKRNTRGKIVSGPREIRNILAREYKDRLRSRPMRPDLKELKKRKKLIFDLKMKLSQAKSSPDWKMSDLEKALSNLKKNKSRDPEGYINEIFKTDVIGADLKRSLLLMFNKIRREKLIASFMNFANVTTVPKKGSLIEPRNERGIFRVSTVRYILMRIIYNMKYPIIDRKMSDCQMGARKNKGCKNNLFIINGLIHEVNKSKKMKPILLQIYDYAQMFDSVDLEQALSDLYDVGVDDDTLALLHKANKNVYMAVKTPSGLTERQTIRNCVLQGETWGSILASVQVDSIGKECMNEGYSYLYKEILPIGFLGLVDDIIGVTEAGLKAQEMNAFINMKTAEKSLQFGPSKCRSMLVGKDTSTVINSNLMVDNWSVQYIENKQTGEDDLKETYCGLTKIKKTNEQKYLGFVLSSTGDNMANIRVIKKKSIGIVKSTLNKLNSLNLKRYYFECSVILLNAMVRSSILYGSDMYYDLKETEVRQIERIEEGYLRQVLNTSKGCPITQLYLAVGHTPARFEIQKMRLLYLKYILEEDDESSLSKFFQLQLEFPTKGDWASTCLKDLEELRIEKSLEDIKLMGKRQFKKILIENGRENAFKYLISKKGSKGKENDESELCMADYLVPSTILTISEKQQLFAMKNRMVNIPANFPKPNIVKKCICGEKEDMKHIHNCEILNDGEQSNLEYEKIFEGNISEQIQVFRKFERNLKRREHLTENKKDITPPCDPLVIRCTQQSLVMDSIYIYIYITSLN